MAAELSAIYRQIADEKGSRYEFLFSLESMFLSVMEFDPVTDEPLPITVDDVLHGLASYDMQKYNWYNDRLQHVVNFVGSAVRNLIDILHEKNLREHRITRPEQIREVDSKCMMWLAKKPGFTVKQKIASEQRMMGVYHITSIDTAENRLFKSFMQKLDELLIEKENACRKRGMVLTDEAERFVSIVHNWLKSDEPLLIGRWNNTPPNNTLLNDKNYRKIWKAHLMLQNLNELVQSDLNRFDDLKNSALFWLVVSRLNLNNDIRFRQTLLFPNYKNLSLSQNAEVIGFARTNTWNKFAISLKADGIVLKLDTEETEYSLPENIEDIFEIFDCVEQVCENSFPKKIFETNTVKHAQTDKPQAVAAVDLNSVLPTFTFGDKTKGRFSKKLVHQSLCIEQIQKDVWYPCFSSKSKLIFTKSKNIKTFSVHSIFDEKIRSEIDAEKDKNAIEKACADFAKTIKDELHCQKCLYITSDDLDDFSPTVNAFKYSMNSAFTKTEILPRSIAALFTHLPDIQNRFRKGDIITVRDIHDDYEVQTKIRIDYDKELANKNPETKGLTFQRLAFNRQKSKITAPHNVVPQNLEGVLTTYDAALLKNSFSVDDFHFEAKVLFPKSAVQKNEIVNYAADDTTFGAVEYDRLQSITPDIPLWSDVLPKLSMIDSTEKEFVLVEPHKVSIRPIVGKPVPIPIPWKFIFPKQKEYYEFPLMQGEKRTKYFAFIKDSSFPLEQETKCRLNLTYTYGIPQPYNLEFISISDSSEFKSVVVKWENKSHKDYIHDMPVPNFVREYTWEDMKSVGGRKKEGNETVRNLIDEWLPREYEKIQNSGVYSIKKEISSNKPEQRVFFLDTKEQYGKDSICYIDKQQEPELGSRVWCIIKKVPKGFEAFDPHVVGGKNSKCEFTKSLRFPALTVWNNGRSIYDEDCPDLFIQETLATIEKLEKCFGKEVPQSVKNEFQFFLSCLHKDMPKWFSDFIPNFLDVVQNHYDYPNWIAYALGDCTQNWQKDLLDKILLLLDDKSKSIYSIKILAKAFWRVNGFVFNLIVSDVKKLMQTLNLILNRKIKNPHEEIAVRSACLECIISLCRLRSVDDVNMLSLLSPKKNPDVEQICDKLKQLKGCSPKIKTFLTFDIKRPKDDKTPELLYAAYGYLSGTIDSNAVKVLEANFGE